MLNACGSDNEAASAKVLSVRVHGDEAQQIISDGLRISLPLWHTQLLSASLVESSLKHFPSKTRGKCTLVSTLVLKLSW